MKFNIHVWRQKDAKAQGTMSSYVAEDVSPDMSFLEMLDELNEKLALKGEDPVAFDYDCREGICGACSLVINGVAHGPQGGTTTCQLHMRSFKDGQDLYVEPFRASAFPVVKDLVVDRSSFDRIIQAGGYVSMNSGSAQDANCLPIPKVQADHAFDAAACIGCGACVAACKNASAMLFVSAKVAQFSFLPQGQGERNRRAQKMVHQMDREGFGNCTNTYECEAVCPKEISAHNIAILNREFLRSSLCSEEEHDS